MRVLISAIACNPYEGSESFVGWSAVKALAKDHELWVMTSPRYREPLALAQAQGAAPANVRFIFHGSHKPWHANRLAARLQSWREYGAWTGTLLPAAQSLHEKIKFDLAHHVTYSTWRIPSPLWRLPIPFVWGPVGGAGSTPVRFLPTMSASGMAFEALRMASNHLGKTRALRACVRNSAAVLASNRETFDVLARLRGTTEGMRIVCPGYFSPEQIEKFRCDPGSKPADGTLRIFAGGNLIGSKGVAIALRGLAMAKREGVSFLYTVAGGGPEAPHLQRLARRLGLGASVRFAPSFHGDEYVHELQRTHIYLLPSFRENIGLTMMEAMLAGCVPIVADCSAPAEIACGPAGSRIAVTSPARMAALISSLLCSFSGNASELATAGKAAAKHIECCYSMLAYRLAMKTAYQDASPQ